MTEKDYMNIQKILTQNKGFVLTDRQIRTIMEDIEKL